MSSDEEEMDLQQELLMLLKEDRLDVFEELLTRADVDHVYEAPDGYTCLHVAVQSSSERAVTLLLSRHARPDVRDSRGFSPLHHAVEMAQLGIIQLLLSHSADINVKTDLERSCLHLVALKWSQNPQLYQQVLDALLAVPGISVDDRDCQQCSPLLLAAKTGAREMCRRLMERGADLDCRVGPHSVRDMIQNKFPELLSSAAIPEEPVQREPGQLLYETLMAEDPAAFQQALKQVMSLDVDARDEALNRRHGNYTPLQFAVDNGMQEFVDDLLESGANPYIVSDSNRFSVLHYACFHGYHTILIKLLEAIAQRGDHMDLNERDSSGETILHKIAKRTPKHRRHDDRVDFPKCMTALLEQGRRIEVNAQDKIGNTALHYASLNEDQSFVEVLLQHGASIGIKNRFGTMPMSRIQPSALETALDNSIRANGVPASESEFSMSFHYDCLIPPENIDPPYCSETEPLYFIGQSPRHRRLLHHPILSSFLLLKWYKIQMLYFINVLLFSGFVALLTAYVYLELDVSPENGEIRPSPSISARGLAVMKLFLGLAVLGMIAREASQVLLSWKAYVRHYQNYIQLVMISLLAVVLLNTGLSQLTRLHVAVWVIILAWIEFVLLIGKHPKLSTYIMMFRTVSENFAKFLFLYSFLIIAFSICFNLLFRTDDHFNTYWRALLKTIVMTTGEMEYTSLGFDRATYSGHMAFIAFIFLIALVLMNLLNGLAVSDTAAIQADAELHSLISRVSLIHYIESMFLGAGLGCLCGGRPVGKRMNQLRCWLANKALLFPRCLTHKKLTVWPNLAKTRFRGCPCHNFILDEKLVEMAQLLVARGERPLHDKVDALEKKMDAVLDLLKQLKLPSQNNP